MQWDDSPNAGFTAPEAKSWLPIAADYRTRNVAAQEADPGSMLNFFRALTALRRAEPALNRGDYEEVDLGLDDVLAYRRTWAGDDGFLVVLNFGGREWSLDLNQVTSLDSVEVTLSTRQSRTGHVPTSSFTLASHEGAIIKV